MTEKRFKADKYYFEIWDNDEFLLSFDQTVDLLNQLNDENEQLKQKLKEHKTTLKGQSNSIYQLKKENELLKRRLEEWV